jgi:hypothetical protein
MATKKKSVVQEMIKESLKDLRQGDFEDDPTLDMSEISGPEKFTVGQKRKDEVVIDSLLSDINGKDGYFLKIKKELRPNEWMLMKTIESEWRRWADMESAVADIVKEHTKASPTKWGSGAYRVEIACKGGMRGKGYSPTDFYINAEEEFVTAPGSVNGTHPVTIVDPNVAVASKIEELSSLVGMIRGIMPQVPDLAKTQEQIAGAFQQGMALKANDSSSQAQMMTAMMTGLMSMMTAMATNNNRPVEKNDDALPKMLETLKSFGVIGQKEQQEKPKTLIDTLAELKMLGLDLFKKDDPLEQVGKLKQIASIAADFMGMQGNGDRPSILEKIVDTLGPALPGLLKDAKDAMGNAVQVQVEAGKNIERAKAQIPQQSMSGGDMRVAKEPVQQQQQQNPQVTMFFNQLHDAVKTNNRMFYPIVYTSLLQDERGQTLLQGITAGTQTAQHVIELLQSYGDARFKQSEFVMKHLVAYVNGFIIWVRQMAGVPQTEPVVQGNASVETHEEENEVANGFDVACPLCRAVYGYTSEKDFAEEVNKECGAMVNGVKCPGALQPLTKAS